MNKYDAKITTQTEWEVSLMAESEEDAKERLNNGDWDITADMEIVLPVEVYEISEYITPVDKNIADE